MSVPAATDTPQLVVSLLMLAVCVCHAPHCFKICDLLCINDGVYLHFGVARLEQRRQQHEVVVLAPHHITLLIVIKHRLHMQPA